MRQPYLIPGESATGPYPQPSPRTRFPVKALFIVWLFGGAGFAVWRLGVSVPKKETLEAAAVNYSSPVIGTYDLTHHLEEVNKNLADAEARLRRAEGRITGTLPAMERNYLYVEKQELQNALAANGAARRDLELAREQADLILKSIKEHQTR